VGAGKGPGGKGGGEGEEGDEPVAEEFEEEEEDEHPEDDDYYQASREVARLLSLCATSCWHSLACFVCAVASAALSPTHGALSITSRACVGCRVTWWMMMRGTWTTMMTAAAEMKGPSSEPLSL
jgi:hypothetical protein